MRLAALALLLALASTSSAGCNRSQDEPASTWRVYLPSVPHDCTPFVCGHVNYVQAVQLCEAEMRRRQDEEDHTLSLSDCADEELAAYGWTPDYRFEGGLR